VAATAWPHQEGSSSEIKPVAATAWPHQEGSSNLSSGTWPHQDLNVFEVVDSPEVKKPAEETKTSSRVANKTRSYAFTGWEDELQLFRRSTVTNPAT
jgi:hypothetical protein